jgi:hypothetical protein
MKKIKMFAAAIALCLGIALISCDKKADIQPTTNSVANSSSSEKTKPNQESNSNIINQESQNASATCNNPLFSNFTTQTFCEYFTPCPTTASEVNTPLNGCKWSIISQCGNTYNPFGVPMVYTVYKRTGTQTVSGITYKIFTKVKTFACIGLSNLNYSDSQANMPNNTDMVIIMHKSNATGSSAYPTTLYSATPAAYPWVYTTTNTASPYQPSNSNGGVFIDVKFFTNGTTVGVNCGPPIN